MPKAAYDDTQPRHLNIVFCDAVYEQGTILTPVGLKGQRLLLGAADMHTTPKHAPLYRLIHESEIGYEAQAAPWMYEQLDEETRGLAPIWDKGTPKPDCALYLLENGRWGQELPKKGPRRIIGSLIGKDTLHFKG